MPVGLLAVAAGWQSAMVCTDARWIRHVSAEGRVFRPELGWTTADQVAARRRWATAALGAVALLVAARWAFAAGVLDAAATGMASAVACAGIFIWLARDRRLHHGRYTNICLASLSFTILVAEVAGLAFDADVALVAGVLGSVFAAQLYLVAGIRKLRAPAFLSGRVLFDTAAHALFQAGAGNREFLPVVRPRQLTQVLASPRFLAGCRVAAVVTVVVELAVGVGALGLLPAAATLALVIPLNLAFVALSPWRILAFASAATGLVVLAVGHPVLIAVG